MAPYHLALLVLLAPAHVSSANVKCYRCLEFRYNGAQYAEFLDKNGTAFIPTGAQLSCNSSEIEECDEKEACVAFKTLYRFGKANDTQGLDIELLWKSCGVGKKITCSSITSTLETKLQVFAAEFQQEANIVKCGLNVTCTEKDEQLCNEEFPEYSVDFVSSTTAVVASPLLLLFAYYMSRAVITWL